MTADALARVRSLIEFARQRFASADNVDVRLWPGDVDAIEALLKADERWRELVKNAYVEGYRDGVKYPEVNPFQLWDQSMVHAVVWPVAPEEEATDE